MPLRQHRESLDALYRQYAHARYIHPDPLEFLYRFDDVADREIVGLIASSLAYGRVAQILRSVESALERMDGSPARFLRDTAPTKIRSRTRGFVHRFTTDDDLARLLIGMKTLLKRYGSLNAAFAGKLSPGDVTVLPALAAFARELNDCGGGERNYLVVSPADGSACKRMNLYLRWMVRRVDVDLGGWRGVDPSMLVVPLDTHMHRLAMRLGATRRKSGDLRTAMEITSAFALLAPDDPVRYDFPLTRMGIYPGAQVPDFLRPRG